MIFLNTHTTTFAYVYVWGYMIWVVVVIVMFFFVVNLVLLFGMRRIGKWNQFVIEYQQTACEIVVVLQSMQRFTRLKIWAEW